MFLVADIVRDEAGPSLGQPTNPCRGVTLAGALRSIARRQGVAGGWERGAERSQNKRARQQQQTVPAELGLGSPGCPGVSRFPSPPPSAAVKRASKMTKEKGQINLQLGTVLVVVVVVVMVVMELLVNLVVNLVLQVVDLLDNLLNLLLNLGG